MNEAPDEFVQHWLGPVPLGRALDVGAGRGEVAVWLASQGFAVDAVESRWRLYLDLWRASRQTAVRPVRRDVRRLLPPSGAYTLVTALAVLHFFRPTELGLVCSRLSSSLAPGGLLLATAFTTDDPGFSLLKQSHAFEVEPNTYRLPKPTALLHFFEPGEMPRLFPDLAPLTEERYRWSDPTSSAGYHSGVRFAACRPAAPGV